MSREEYDNYDRDRFINSLVYNDDFDYEEASYIANDWERENEKK